MSNRCNYFGGDGWAYVVLESVVLGGAGRASGPQRAGESGSASEQ